MSVCTFFGHRDCPAEVKPKLRKILTDLIENQAVDTFFVGNKGLFDLYVLSVLREMAQKYSQIHYTVVLEKITKKPIKDLFGTMLPEGIENVPPRFAISWRNKWMLQQSDFVVTYITHSWGGASQFAVLAERQKKTVIRLGISEDSPPGDGMTLPEKPDGESKI